MFRPVSCKKEVKVYLPAPRSAGKGKIFFLFFLVFFSFDTTDLVKGDIEKRFGAYKIAIDSGFMQIDEVREKEKLPAFGLDFIKLGLQDVLYSPSSKTVYTPNTDKTSKMGENPVKEEPEKKEGEEDAD